jgi:hypothetical protein
MQRDEVLAYCQAKPQDGGEGALLVLLRAPKNKGSLSRPFVSNHQKNLDSAASFGLAGANTYHLLNRHDKNLAVADFAGTRRLDDGVNGGINVLGIDDDFDLDLGQEIDDILGTAIQLGMALLAAETLDLGDGQAGNTDFRKRFTHFVEFERLDDGFDFLHVLRPLDSVS